MATHPVYLAIRLLAIGSWFLGNCAASSSSSTTSSSLATWMANYCETQLEVFDANHDGTLQESEQTEFLQSLLTSSATCAPQDIAAVESAMIDLCGSNCRFQNTERAFCTVVAKAMQGHCTTEPITYNATTLPVNTTNITTLYFFYTVAFNISDHVTYSIHDREQWLITAFNQVAKTIWQAVGVNPMYTQQQQQQQQQLRGHTMSSGKWTSFNQSNIRPHTSNSSTQELFSGFLSTNITVFQNLRGNDQWNVTHAVELQQTPWSNGKYRYYPYRLEAFSQSLQSQLPNILWDNLNLPTGVTLQQDLATTMPTVDTSNSPTLYLETQPPTLETTDGIIPSPLAEGLQIWMIVLIAVSGAMASGILYLICFHSRPKPVAPPPHRSPTTPDNNRDSHTTNNHTSISITVTESSVPHKGDGQPSKPSIATSDMINNNDNKNNNNMKSIVVSTNTLATLDPTPPTTPIRTNVSPELARTKSIHSSQNNLPNFAHETDQGNNNPNNNETEEEKEEEKATRPTGVLGSSSSQRTIPKSSSRSIGYHVDQTGRIVPISFLSDRDSRLHVFEDTSEVHSRRWSSSSSSSSSFPTSRKKNSVSRGDQGDLQRQGNDSRHDDAGHSWNNHNDQEAVTLSPGVVTSRPPVHPATVVSSLSPDERASPEQMVDDSSYYSGVYYGEDDCDHYDNYNGNTNDEGHFVGSHDFQEDMIDPDIPVYGGVYYGSDGDDEVPPPKARSGANIRSRPVVDYFAGIHIGQNASTSSISTVSKEHGHDGGEEWSVDSRRSRASSLMSAEEREWQRRLRDDLLHPVKEDAAIVDTTVVNLSGFTTVPTNAGRGDTTKRGNRRRKER